MARLCLVLLLGLAVAPLHAAAPPADTKRELSVEELARRVKPSVVVIRLRGRDGKPESVGTGFVIRADGLIATNQHVIGEGRRITVETSDGKEYDVVTVHASDRKADLALVKIDAKGLTPLVLGDPSKLADGQSVVALGNPKGLKHSVVAGVVSGRRLVEGRAMIQLAIPIEPGNSGGPLLDRRGRVVGVMTSKSLLTDNLGFAMPISALLPLVQKPNPVPMAAWMTIGVLDPDEWQTRGGRWRQRAGRISGEGGGEGIGKRSLCILQRDTPAVPFEVGVGVRLDEDGAAGLIFHSDGKDRHYGFYPTGGKLRLVRFSGADVFSWKVLSEKGSAAYRKGEFNTLKVRVEKGRLKCYVNDALVFDLEEDEFTEGKVGLARFRDTTAEFRQFRVGKSLPSLSPTKELLAKIDKLSTAKDDTKKLSGDAVTLAALREKAKQLEEQAAKLRKLAVALHEKSVRDELAKLLSKKDDEVDLIHAALLIAKLDNDEIDVDVYRSEVERMAKKVSASLKKDASEQDRLEALNRFLFREKGFHGSRSDYYNRSNSYLSEVIDDREGLPITLSVLYLELARRIGVKVEGVGLPAHFVVRHVPTKGKPQLIDVYDGGTKMSLDDAKKKVRDLTDRDLEDDDLKAVPKKLILVRMLYNLMNVARNERDLEGMLRYVETIVAIVPDSAEERGLRASLRYQTGDLDGALEDVEWLLDKKPDGVDLERVRQMKRFLERAKKAE